MIVENLNTDIIKKITLQMTVKAINDTTDPDELVLTLLMFDAYSRMHTMNPSALTISQRALIIEKAMTEVRKIRAERQVADALNARNESIVTSIHDLSINSDVLV
jgi:cell division protein FtsB